MLVGMWEVLESALDLEKVDTLRSALTRFVAPANMSAATPSLLFCAFLDLVRLDPRLLKDRASGPLSHGEH